jgi:hypothetical protein
MWISTASLISRNEKFIESIKCTALIEIRGKRQFTCHLAEIRSPSGILLLCDVIEEFFLYSHPVKKQETVSFVNL